MSEEGRNFMNDNKQNKAGKILDALQNVPDELLERSERESATGSVIVFIKQHKQLAVACAALVFAGLCFIGYRSAGMMENMATSDATNSMLVNTGGTNWEMTADGAQMNDAEYAVEESSKPEAENKPVQEIQDKASVSTDVTDSYTDDYSPLKDNEVDVRVESAIGLNGKNDLYAAYMPKKLPEGYSFDAVSMSKGEKAEVLQVRLVNAEGKYMQFIIQKQKETEAGGEVEKENPEEIAVQKALPAADLTQEAVESLRAATTEEEVKAFTVDYGEGVTVECSGDAEAADFFEILSAYIKKDD